MLKSIARLIGGSSERVLKRLDPILAEINELEPDIEALSDEQLRDSTTDFRSRLNQGEDLDDLMPEAFAVVREAAKRTLGQRHFDVQLIGGIVLHQGKIAEMRTGEGKTLVSTLPAYLNALTGRGVHIVTVNDYLARRDAQWMGAIFHLLGLSIGILQHDSAQIYDPSGEGDPGLEHLTEVPRKEAYAADVTYGTNNEFGFDYLRDNMVVELAQRVQRPLAYAIVDEVDNILIDEARTPLIISGAAAESTKEYNRFARLVPTLSPDTDYAIDEKHRTVSLTIEGTSQVERMLNVGNLYDPDNLTLVHFIENALQARALYERDSQYIVKDGEVIIVDEFTGRQMPGRRYSDGLHQALEAKEGLNVRRQSITYATITLQNYFRLYSKLAGMTGTAATEAEELWKIYKLEVTEIPTNLPMTRDDRVDQIYKDQKVKYAAVVDEIEEKHKIGQPVLVGTTDISKSELLSEQLKRRGIPHEVLNAKHHEREALIVAEAGKPGAVTVATNMAGRGTDIVLGGNPEALDISQGRWQTDHNKVVEVGGLHIIGTQRHEARRIDNQLRGRSGRQGDPGSSRFYVALDDDLMRRFGGEKIQAVMKWAGMDGTAPLENKMISRSIEGAQVKVEAYHFDIRKHLVEYDDVVNTQRSVIYGERNKVLTGADLKSNIQGMVESGLADVVSPYIDGISPEDWDIEGMLADLESICPLKGDIARADSVAQMDPEEIEQRVLDNAMDIYEDQEAKLSPELMRTIEREVMLRTIDINWVPHLTAMENLRQGIGLYAYGQRDPLVMYKKEGMEMFETLKDRIQHDIVHTIYNVNVRTDQRDGSPKGQVRGRRNGPADSEMLRVSGRQSQEAATSAATKVGRNETCPCGSGKKYKRCHGR